MNVPWAVSGAIATLGVVAFGLALFGTLQVRQEDNQTLTEDIARLSTEVSRAEKDLADMRNAGLAQSGELKSRQDENGRMDARIASRRAEVIKIEDQNRDKIAQSQQKTEEARQKVISEVNDANSLLQKKANQEKKQKILQQILKDDQDAIITVGSATGDLATGFLFGVSNSGFLAITSSSVVARNVPLQVKMKCRLPGSTAKSVVVVQVRRAIVDPSGIALLVLNLPQGCNVTGFTSNAIAETKAGEKVFATGTQVLGDMMLEFNIFDGVVSSTNRHVRGEEMLQLSMPSNEGASGSPLLSESGRLIGVLLESLEGLEKTSVALPATQLLNIIKRAR